MNAPAAVVAACLTAALSAQQASYVYTPQPAPYVEQGWLTPLSLPRLGNTFQMQIPASRSSYCGDAIYLVLWSVGICWIDTQSWPVMGDGLGFMFAGVWMVPADVVQWAPFDNTNPNAVLSTGVPNAATLLGCHFFNQVIGPSSLGGCGGLVMPTIFAFSGRGEGVIGF